MTSWILPPAATDLKRIAVIQKASLKVILKKKPREHVSSFFKTAKIMPVKLLFEFCSLKLFLKTFSAEFIKTLHFDHDYNTRFSGLRTKKVNNKRGERSLLCHGVNLYNRYQLDAVTFTQAGPWDGLAARLWAGVWWLAECMRIAWHCRHVTMCDEENFSWPVSILASAIRLSLCFAKFIFNHYS